ncbi:ATP-binding protein [Marinomonas sp. 2405UD68-3]|uniref:ATP-binding protein n=1 Tax=Marinomonas sp. 2405UD68-3 TaxID=3391835 RepID=UPI0039C9DB85
MKLNNTPSQDFDRRGTITIRTSLILRTLILLSLCLSTFFLGSKLLILDPSADEISSAQVNLVNQQIQFKMDGLFDEVEDLLRVGEHWLINKNYLPEDIDELNHLFSPILKQRDIISGAIFATSDGTEWFLMKQDNGHWTTRMTNLPEWGMFTRWNKWNSLDQLPERSWGRNDYDPTLRPWFKGALAMPENQIHWTAPYIFFTAQAPGITASIRWRLKDGRDAILALDVQLNNLSAFTSSQTFGKQGQTMVLTDDLTMLGLPASSLTQSRDLSKLILQSIDESLEGALLNITQDWAATGKKANDIIRYSEEQGDWAAKFTPFQIGSNTIWSAVMAPIADFSPNTSSRTYQLIGILVLVLLLSTLVTVQMAEKFVRPLRQLLGHSKRIARMDLSARKGMESPIFEIQQLFSSHETMRINLDSATNKLIQANETLELKVKLRTEEFVTAKQQAERQELQTQQILRLSPISMMVVNVQTLDILSLNTQFEHLIGYTIQDASNMKQLARLLMPDEDYRHLILTLVKQQYLLSNSEQEEAAPPIEVNFVCRTGTIRLFQIHSTFFEDLSVIGMIDLTEQRRFEIKLNEAKELAESAAQSKSEFLANMSHEIRTPMNAIIGLSHLALKTEMNAKLRDYFTKISTSSHLLLSILNDILDFSKIEAGKMDVEDAPFRIQEVIENLTMITSMNAANKGLDLIVDLPSDLPHYAIGDSLRLGQILINLVNNAIKFTKEGEVCLTITTQDVDDDYHWLKFAITDTGIGLTEEQQGRLFQAFSQADGSTSRKFGGTGLGLTISKHLTELMGGAIGVESESGKGSCFFFNIRLGKDEQSESVALPDLSKKLPGQVVLLEHNSKIAQLQTRYLQQLGMSVTQVDTTQALLPLLDSCPALLILNLADAQHSDLIRYSQEPPANRAVIIATGSLPEDHPDNVTGGLNWDAFLQNPTIPTTLQQAIHTALSLDIPVHSVHPQDEEKPPYHGAHVLLVEDNEINQQVAMEMLNFIKISADIAGNGVEAIRAMENGPYDAILMDLQMPIMDGYESTKTIRQNPLWQSIPIIAMTANVMQSDKDQCLQAGMNDHISKPILAEQLHAKLSHWVITDASSSPISITDGPIEGFNETAAEEDDGLLHTIPGLAFEESINRLQGNKTLYRKLLFKFADSQQDCIALLQTGIASNQWKEAERLAHTLKGVAANIGAKNIQHAAQIVESHLEQHKQPDLTQLAHILEPFISAIKALQPKENTQQEVSAEPLVNSPELQDTLEQLIQLLEEYDSDALNSLDKLIALSGPNPQWTLITEAIEEYNFETALTLVQKVNSDLNPA